MADTTRDSILTIRFRELEREQVEKAAEVRAQYVSELVRQAALREAREVLDRKAAGKPAP